ncbi:hypothetical protein EDC36_10323 [Tepidimonas ignava]|uniref:Uncharacterized protein n=1 Tax=Tepidimonas ignava TaxID=114249 RepID=A0A4V2UWE4_9BURK|nr:hypothetical protein [Tepidimonas ignava]TCS98967.1 hypothetical protein EDC36_10323 [Tepidimonas ignava]TSE22950.1 hypothetical protein Tigna_00932 [Tepidimonas ignava]
MSLPPETDADASPFEAFFRDPDAALGTSVGWALAERAPLIEALRGLLSGPAAWVRLRLWCFLELATIAQGRLDREALQQRFHAVQPAALEQVLKRLRELGLLAWDATAHDYTLPPLARQLHALLAPLAQPPSDDDELAPLLAQAAGAHALGLTQPAQLQHLHAQLARLHDDFEEAITSGSEARLRAVQPRFERALGLVERAGEALTALIRSGSDHPRLEREARALGYAQARLLAMASQFHRALQQLDRQRVTLGSTGVTSSDVRDWLRGLPAAQLARLAEGALLHGVAPVFVSQHDLLDVAEAEWERDRPDPARSQALPPPHRAGTGDLDVPPPPAELLALIDALTRWREAQPHPHPLPEAVLGGRYAQAAYRLQLLPLLGDAQAAALQGPTGTLARSGWRAEFSPTTIAVDDAAVQRVSDGTLLPPQPLDTPGP